MSLMYPEFELVTIVSAAGWSERSKRHATAELAALRMTVRRASVVTVKSRSSDPVPVLQLL
jgi:hypothetical protein